MAGGSITCCEFQKQAVAFCEASKGSSQEWAWISQAVAGCSCQGWMALRRWPISRKRAGISATHDDSLLSGMEEELEEEDDVSALPPIDTRNQDAMFEYHVVHSGTYQVPVLYLRGQDTASGSLLRPELVWRLCCSTEAVKKGEAANVPLPTPDEHPVTGEPFLFLHPCRTQECLHQMGISFNGARIESAEDGNFGYVLLWLSIYGAAVALSLDASVRGKVAA